MTELRQNLRPPKGYRVTVVKCTGALAGWFDCRVFKNAHLALESSGTAFESKETARLIGISRAWDIYEGKTQWT